MQRVHNSDMAAVRLSQAEYRAVEVYRRATPRWTFAHYGPDDTVQLESIAVGLSVDQLYQLTDVPLPGPEANTGAGGPLPDDALLPARPRTTPALVRFDDGTLQLVKALAFKRHKGYQTLFREFVAERLATEEQRETGTGS